MTEVFNPVVSVRLRRADNYEHPLVCVTALGDGPEERVELVFPDLGYYAGVVKILQEHLDYGIRERTEGWENIQAEIAERHGQPELNTDQFFEGEQDGTDGT